MGPTIFDAIESFTERGYAISVENGDLKITGRPLSDTERRWLRDNKSRLIAVINTPPEVCQAARKKIDWALRQLADDCLDWYVEDLGVIADMAEDETNQLLLDYLGKRDWYRRNQAGRALDEPGAARST
jgi:hypothetical protein